MQPLALSESQIDDVVAFLASLTSAHDKEQGTKELDRQHSLSRTSRPLRDTARAFGPKPVQPKVIPNCAAIEPEAKPMLKSFSRRQARDCKMLDLRSTFGQRKYRCMFVCTGSRR
jgi:hypothetical protein